MKNNTSLQKMDLVLEESTDYEEKMEEEYEVERILDHKKKRDGSNSFLLLWKGYPESEATWQDESDLNCENLIKEYFALVNAANDEKKSKAKKKAHLEGSSESPRKKKQRRDSVKSSDEVSGSLTHLEYSSLLKEDADWRKLVDCVTTLERDEENQLFVHLQLRNGDQTICPSEIVRKKCPDVLLDFYENNLKFRKSDES